MKLKAVEAIVKKEKQILVSEAAYCQWMICRGACYPLYGLPPMGKAHFFRMFDIPEDKWDKYYYNEVELPTDICFDDVIRAEQVVDRGTLRIVSGGRVLEPLKTSQGLIFIDTRYLVPFADLPAGYELYERTSADGTPYIAVKDGMELCGVVMPFRLVDEKFVATLEELLLLSKVALENSQQQAAVSEMPALVEDDEDG